RSHPHDRRIIRIERDPANRVGSLAIEHRSPSRSVVHRLPHSTRRHPDVILKLVPRIHRNRHHTSRSHRRPKQPKFQPGESVGRHTPFFFFFRHLFLLVFLLIFLRFFLRFFLARRFGRYRRLFVCVLVLWLRRSLREGEHRRQKENEN